MTTQFRASQLGGTEGSLTLEPRSASHLRLALEVYPLSARTRSGRIRGLPLPLRGTLISPRVAAIMVVSLMLPAVRTAESIRPFPSVAM